LMALAIASHRALPEPVRLSKVSGRCPGRLSTTLVEDAAVPGPIEACRLLPSVPVYLAVRVMQLVSTAMVAATSVPSVTRTSRKLFRPSWLAMTTWVIRSYLRFCGWPNHSEASLGPPAITGELTGPQVAVPTMPPMLVGTPLMLAGGGAWTLIDRPGTVSAAGLPRPWL